MAYMSNKLRDLSSNIEITKAEEDLTLDGIKYLRNYLRKVGVKPHQGDFFAVIDPDALKDLQAQLKPGAKWYVPKGQTVQFVRYERAVMPTMPLITGTSTKIVVDQWLGGNLSYEKAPIQNRPHRKAGRAIKKRLKKKKFNP